MPWTINSEIYPLWARSTGNACAAGVNWTFNILVSLTFLHLAQYFTYYGQFLLAAQYLHVRGLRPCQMFPPLPPFLHQQVSPHTGRNWLFNKLPIDPPWVMQWVNGEFIGFIQ